MRPALQLITLGANKLHRRALPCGRQAISLPSTMCNLQPAAAVPACCNASRNSGTVQQHVRAESGRHQVVADLRSSELRTTAREALSVGVRSAINHAPPCHAADRSPRLLRMLPKLTDRTPDPEPPPATGAIGKHRPTADVIDALHQRHSARRKTRRCQRRVPSVSDNGLTPCPTHHCQCAAPQYCRAQNPGGIGKYIRATFEDKRDNAHAAKPLARPSSRRADAVMTLPRVGGASTPGPQTGNHVAAHALIGEQPVVDVREPWRARYR